MRRLAVLLVIAACAHTPARVEPPREADVAAVLDGWHAAAAAADEERYFGAFTDDAIFMGTDARERWTRDELRAWAKRFFARGKAWSFKAVERHVSFVPGGQTAYFDELLATPNLGPARSSGVLVRAAGGWKIAQYNLSVPIPNEIIDDVVKQIASSSPKP